MNDDVLSQLLDVTSEGHWEWDLDTDRAVLNPRYCELLGYPAEDTVMDGKQLFSLILPEDRAALATLLDGHSGDERPACVEYRMRSSDGSYRWLQGRGKVVAHDAQGRPTRMVGTVSDLSAHKEQAAALQASEQRFRAFVENANDVVFTLTPAGRFAYLSPNWSEALGHELTEALGQPFDPYVHPDDVALCHEFLCQVLQTGRRQSGIEFRVRHRDGHWRWYTVSGACAVADGGTEPVFLGIGHDITDKKEIEAQLRAAKEQAEAASRAKSTFLANMSHELRTPLNGILGMLYLLDRTSLDARQEEYVAMAVQAGRSLLELLNGLLDLSMIEAGRLQVGAEPFDPRALVRDGLGSVRASAAGKQLALNLDFDPALPEVVHGDPLRLRQILLHLLGNAVKFTPAGEVGCSLRLLDAADAGRPRLEIAVRDTGIGIAAHQLEQIFDPFAQVETSYRRRFQGAGLGLAIVKRLTEAMGGTVKIDSAPGAGTVVSVTIPLRDPAAVSGDGDNGEGFALRPAADLQFVAADLAEQGAPEG